MIRIEKAILVFVLMTCSTLQNEIELKNLDEIYEIDYSDVEKGAIINIKLNNKDEYSLKPKVYILIDSKYYDNTIVDNSVIQEILEDTIINFKPIQAVVFYAFASTLPSIPLNNEKFLNKVIHFHFKNLNDFGVSLYSGFKVGLQLSYGIPDSKFSIDNMNEDPQEISTASYFGIFPENKLRLKSKEIRFKIVLNKVTDKIPTIKNVIELQQNEILSKVITDVDLNILNLLEPQEGFISQSTFTSNNLNLEFKYLAVDSFDEITNENLIKGLLDGKPLNVVFSSKIKMIFVKLSPSKDDLRLNNKTIKVESIALESISTKSTIALKLSKTNFMSIYSSDKLIVYDTSSFAILLNDQLSSYSNSYGAEYLIVENNNETEVKIQAFESDYPVYFISKQKSLANTTTFMNEGTSFVLLETSGNQNIAIVKDLDNSNTSTTSYFVIDGMKRIQELISKDDSYVKGNYSSKVVEKVLLKINHRLGSRFYFSSYNLENEDSKISFDNFILVNVGKQQTVKMNSKESLNELMFTRFNNDSYQINSISIKYLFKPQSTNFAEYKLNQKQLVVKKDLVNEVHITYQGSSSHVTILVTKMEKLIYSISSLSEQLSDNTYCLRLNDSFIDSEDYKLSKIDFRGEMIYKPSLQIAYFCDNQICSERYNKDDFTLTQPVISY